MTKMTKMDERHDITRIYNISVPVLVCLGLVTYQHNLGFLTLVYLSLAAYFTLLTCVGSEVD
jgi:hypothetical protein